MSGEEADVIISGFFFPLPDTVDRSLRPSPPLLRVSRLDDFWTSTPGYTRPDYDLEKKIKIKTHSACGSCRHFSARASAVPDRIYRFIDYHHTAVICRDSRGHD